MPKKAAVYSLSERLGCAIPTSAMRTAFARRATCTSCID